MNVLIYNSTGVSSVFFAETFKTLSLLLCSNYDVQPVSPVQLASKDWFTTTKLLVIPGGRDLPYCEQLNGNCIRNIREFVNNGGSYLGLCAGAYFACTYVEFEVGTKLQVIGERELSLVGAKAVGAVCKDFKYLGSGRNVEIKDEDGELVQVWYEGGCCFEPPNAENWKTVFWYDSMEGYKFGDEKKSAVVEATFGNGKVVLSGVHPEYNYNDRLLKLWQSLFGFLGLHTGQEDNSISLATNFMIYMNTSLPILHKKKDLLDTFILSEEERFTPNEILLIRLTNDSDLNSDNSPFRVNVFTSQLNTRYIGRKFGYSPLLSSTQTVLEKNINYYRLMSNGFTLIAGKQINGRGRGSNTWISPKGCLSFSVKLVQKDYTSLVFVQYIMSLAAVMALRELGNIPLRIKWPNDIYAEFDGLKVKVGGVLVTSSYDSGVFELVVGCGLNVTNASPTISISRWIPNITCEVALAAILNEFESLYEKLNARGFDEELQELYYNNWLHSNQKVSLEDGTLMRIVGITAEGFLQGVVMSSEQRPLGTTLQLQPNGNSFDLMRGLILQKK